MCYECGAEDHIGNACPIRLERVAAGGPERLPQDDPMKGGKKGGAARNTRRDGAKDAAQRATPTSRRPIKTKKLHIGDHDVKIKPALTDVDKKRIWVRSG